MYYSLVHPHILYGVELYANTYSIHLDSLVKVNNKILRILQNKPLRTKTLELYSNYNTLTIPLLFKFQILKLMHKYIHIPDLLPSIYREYFTINSAIHDHETRRCHDLHQSSYYTSLGQRSIKNRGVQLWNSIPVIYKLKMEISSFKFKLKRYLFNLI